MDTFWDFIEPLVYNNNLLIKYDEFLKTQFGFNETFQVRFDKTSILTHMIGHFVRCVP